MTEKKAALTMGAIKWHYTIGVKYALIDRDGFIKPATAFVSPGERPIVWLSTNAVWEPTANKMRLGGDGHLVSLTMAETAALGGGLVRIGVAAETAPHDWNALKELSGMSTKTARGLYDAAIAQRARPGEWWGSFEPIPRSKWIKVQGSFQGDECLEWLDLMKEEAMTAADEHPRFQLRVTPKGERG